MGESVLGGALYTTNHRPCGMGRAGPMTLRVSNQADSGHERLLGGFPRKPLAWDAGRLPQLSDYRRECHQYVVLPREDRFAVRGAARCVDIGVDRMGDGAVLHVAAAAG